MDYNIDLNEFDITVIRGTSEEFKFWGWEVVEESTGNIVPWSLMGKNIRIQFKSDLNTSDIALELTIGNKGLTVEPTVLTLHFGLNTIELKRDVYYYDILIIDGSERATMVRGKLILTGIVTK
ncbi:hypothetical protein OHD16_21360 [Sphingobacterium sp. ML3W]|uniref:hypothetical protein n=1 Tax=Sphingobacterium sp. ML3W TaxID=1538644 RepID=UPI00249ADADD|nr:hypothetical protein [Sphingobacterium sp. ML3W]WFA77280.1 hypothetical protein OGI71_14500 [Sphingobacterium sp. ML3W]